MTSGRCGTIARLGVGKVVRTGVVVVALNLAGSAALDAQADSKSSIALSQRLFDAVRLRMNGDSAKRIVAFVGSRWRLPGNHGFDESIDRVVESLSANGYVEEREAKLARID